MRNESLCLAVQGGNLWGGAVADLPPGYAGLSRLRFLTLTNCGLTALPPTVAGMTSLILLKLNLNRLRVRGGRRREEVGGASRAAVGAGRWRAGLAGGH